MREAIEKRARAALDEIISFLCRLVAIPSPSGGEGRVAAAVTEEMQRLGYAVSRARLGSVVGRLGSGRVKILYDAHMDTVGIGDPRAWPCDPYSARVAEGAVWGRGAADAKGSLASMVYGGWLMKELGLSGDFTLYLVASVMEEDCEGLCYKSLFEDDRLVPDYVLIGEPSGLKIMRGQRGRIEFKITARGVSCHASAPERGVNPIYRLVPLISRIAELDSRLPRDPFLGRGSVAVTSIECHAASLNAIPDSATIYLDRRLTAGESRESALEQIQNIAGEAEIEIPWYRNPSYTGVTIPVEKYYPAWCLDEDHRLVRAAAECYAKLFDEKPAVSRWDFSTNGVYTMGVAGVPSIGFGPGLEELAHTVREHVPVEQVLRATMFYALLPALLAPA